MQSRRQRLQIRNIYKAGRAKVSHIHHSLNKHNAQTSDIMSASFTYHDLDSSRKEIRLMHFTSSPDVDDDLIWEMRVTSLIVDKPLYLGLSYTWGVGALTDSMNINGGQILVTANLKAGLEQWARRVVLGAQGFEDKPGFWADALCINQADDKEKSSQIKLMGDIYRSAWATVVWLGPQAKDEDIAVGTIQGAADVAQDLGLSGSGLGEWRNDPDQEEYISSAIHSLSVGPGAPADIPLQPMLDFFQKRWWRRVWTLQEVKLAQRVFVLCGPAVLHPQTFRDCLVILEAKHSLIQGRMECERDLRVLQHLLALIGGACVQLYPQESKESLLRVLDTAKLTNKECSDPRDHFFGLLGMVNAQCAEMGMLRDVSYANDISEVYTAVAKALLKVHGPEVLSYCYMDDQASRSAAPALSISTCKELPSWVPDWRRYIHPLQGHICYRGNPLYRSSDCFSDSEINDPMEIDGSLLSIDGLFVDTIQTKAERFPSLEGYLTLQSRILVWKIWMTSIKQQLPKAIIDQADTTSLSRTIIRASCAEQLPVVNFDSHASQVVRRISETTDNWMLEELIDILMTDDVRDFVDPHLDEYLSEVVKLDSDYRIFLTTNGSIGLGRKGCEPGDIVAILRHVSAPFLLRAIESNGQQQYHIVGDAYLDGIMDGEYETSPLDSKRFIIS